MGSFYEALQSSIQILSQSPILVEKNLITSESETLMIYAYKRETGVGLSRLDLYSKMHEVFPPAAAERLAGWLAMRVEGKLLQHITGFQFFLDHDYQVSSDVLVPRPETEILVTSAIAELNASPSPPLLGLEIGVGSGIISIELLSRFLGLRMIASELSEAAQVCAIRNSELILGPGDLGSTRLRVIQAEGPQDVWQPFNSIQAVPPADFLIMNPPYLASRDEVDADVLEFEPDCALFAPQGDPCFFYRVVAERVREFVRPGGFVFAEIPHERAKEISEIFCKWGLSAKTVLDLNQRERVIIAQIALPKQSFPKGMVQIES